MTLKVHIFAGGERFPILHDDRGTPIFFPTLYATTQLRNAGAAVNTIKSKLMDVVVLSRWEEAHQRDLLSEFSQGKFLSIPDIVSLRDFARLDMREHRELPTRTKATVKFLEARTAPVRLQKGVAKRQHYNRMSTFADYLGFLASAVTQHRNDPEVAMEIARMAKTIRRHRPRGLAGFSDDDPHAKSPPTDIVERFMQVSSVEDPRNPYKDPAIRLRNAIIFGLLRYTGMRRGELLSLRIDQFDFGDEPFVWVRRNQDDRFDSRRHQPVAKTKERPLHLPDALAAQVQGYVMDHRARVAPARKHPYLLVSHRKGRTFGTPLSQSALGNQIMQKMREVDPTFSCIHPHAFRHHFNYELSRLIDEHNARARKNPADGLKPMSDANELDMRAFLNGQRSRASGLLYNQRHIRESSDKAIRSLQNAMIKNRERTGNDESPT